jgi:putative PIN family toxin of toxin-antitoxin system
MKVVINTNVVVSAVLRDRLPEAVVRFVVEHAECEWFATQEILNEYIDVLRRPKFGLPEATVAAWNDLFARSIRVIEGVPQLQFARDPKDAMFLSCALFVEADFLITGDRDFKEAYKIIKTTILSVAQFKALVCDQWTS